MREKRRRAILARLDLIRERQVGARRALASDTGIVFWYQKTRQLALPRLDVVWERQVGRGRLLGQAVAHRDALVAHFLPSGEGWGEYTGWSVAHER